MITVSKALWFFKTYIYSLFVSIFMFYSTARDISNSNLNNTLLLDYENLILDSRTMRGYEITADEFNSFFKEGLFKSLEFYKSSEHVFQSDINNLIETNLYENSSLYHQIEYPKVAKVNLSVAFSSLSQFSGEWHGNWKNTQVHHLWLPVRKCVKEITDEVTLMGFQSCFTGDGFGWNYVVKQNKQVVVLGFVIHFNNDKNISSKNPHYAFLNNSDQLIWVSEDHVYYEFVCNKASCFEKRHYVICGAAYKEQKEQLKFTHGFQTIYLPDTEDLPAFKSIK